MDINFVAQVSLLLKYLKCDPREAVKSESLQNLNILARSAPHLWTDEDSSMLCEVNAVSRDVLPPCHLLSPLFFT